MDLWSKPLTVVVFNPQSIIQNSKSEFRIECSGRSDADVILVYMLRMSKIMGVTESQLSRKIPTYAPIDVPQHEGLPEWALQYWLADDLDVTGEAERSNVDQFLRSILLPPDWDGGPKTLVVGLDIPVLYGLYSVPLGDNDPLLIFALPKEKPSTDSSATADTLMAGSNPVASQVVLKMDSSSRLLHVARSFVSGMESSITEGEYANSDYDSEYEPDSDTLRHLSVDDNDGEAPLDDATTSPKEDELLISKANNETDEDAMFSTRLDDEALSGPSVSLDIGTTIKDDTLIVQESQDGETEGNSLEEDVDRDTEGSHSDASVDDSPENAHNDPELQIESSETKGLQKRKKKKKKVAQVQTSSAEVKVKMSKKAQRKARKKEKALQTQEQAQTSFGSSLAESSGTTLSSSMSPEILQVLHGMQGQLDSVQGRFDSVQGRLNTVLQHNEKLLQHNEKLSDNNKTFQNKLVIVENKLEIFQQENKILKQENKILKQENKVLTHKLDSVKENLRTVEGRLMEEVSKTEALTRQVQHNEASQVMLGEDMNEMIGYLASKDSVFMNQIRRRRIIEQAQISLARILALPRPDGQSYYTASLWKSHLGLTASNVQRCQAAQKILTDFVSKTKPDHQADLNWIQRLCGNTFAMQLISHRTNVFTDRGNSAAHPSFKSEEWVAILDVMYHQQEITLAQKKSFCILLNIEDSEEL